MDDRHRLIFGLAIIVAVLLPLSLLASGPYHQPYEEFPRTYGIAHESTEGYERFVEMPEPDYFEELDANDPTAVSELNLEAQLLFHEMRDQPREYGITGWGDGWQRVEIRVCASGMLVCDVYSSPPDLGFTAWLGDHPRTEAGVIEHDGETYIAAQGIENPPFHLTPFLWLLAMLGVVTVFGVFTVAFTWMEHDSNPTLALSFIGIGALFALWPYLVMIPGIGIVADLRLYRDVAMVGLGVLGLVWFGYRGASWVLDRI